MTASMKGTHSGDSVGVPAHRDPAESGHAHLVQALEADRVAIIGASTVPGKMGYQVVKQAVLSGYAGDLVLVNPKGGFLDGRPLVPLEAVEGCDVAVLAVPAEHAVSAMAEAAVLGVQTFIVLSAGFAESGRTDLDNAVINAVAGTGARILGPNCLGLFSASNRLNLTTLPTLPRGTVTVASQSGGLVAQTARRLEQLGEGFDSIITVGNRLDLKLADAVYALADRPDAGTLLLYLESFDEGDRLLGAIDNYRARGPVVVLMGGRSLASRRAAASHTGSLFGQRARICSLLEDSGAFVTHALEEAVAASCAGSKGASGERIFTVCDGGGHSVLLADAIDAHNLLSPDPSEASKATLGELLSRPASSITNPLDLAGAADRDIEMYSAVAKVVAASGEYDGLAVAGSLGSFATFFGPAAAQQELNVAEALGKLRGKLPVAVQTPVATEESDALRRMRQASLPVFEWPSELAAWFAAQKPPPAKYGSMLTHGHVESTHEMLAQVDPTLTAKTEVVRRLLRRLSVGDGIGDVVEAGDLVDLDSRTRWAIRVDGFPHKRDYEAIRLNVATDDLRKEWDSLSQLARRHELNPTIRVARMMEFSHEFLLTVWGNGADGCGIALGHGGSSVETTVDVALGRIPTQTDDVVRLLGRTTYGRQFLRDVGEEVHEFAHFVIAFSQAISSDLSEFSEVELNPVVVGPDGVSVLDALPQLRTQEQGTLS